MTVPADQTLFFSLPLELRQLIYNSVLASPQHGPQLLRTCREIHSEAQKFLFERPLNFRSQVALFDWLDQVPHEYLSQTKELSLSIQDVDLRSLLDATALISHPGDPPRLLTWDLYEAELDKLHRGLNQLPKIQKITIRAIAGRQSFLYRDFLKKFLVLLTSLYPDLLELRLEGNLHHQDLSFLSRFSRLQALSFDGFCASSPLETAKILSGLEHLTSLSLVSQSAMLAADSHTHSTFTSRRQSLTGEVVNAMNNLKYFSVTEINPVAAPTLYFTPEVLASLQNHKGLKVIKVCLSRAPSRETMTALERFLEHTRINVLELDWPQLHFHMLETFSLIPKDLEKLWVRVRSAADAVEMIQSIAKSRGAGDLCALDELVLLRSMQTYNELTSVINDGKDLRSMHSRSGDTDASNIVRAQSRLQSLGVRVSWCTEAS
ncbi:hypothetical protein C7974DRAFT_44882 [Boeremia exigua]|uniref:uncharacterized protein n=1 Tax=Boeremia exigua TaxID=749465 RepID=UPI001E8DB391|nr:uncharacterized protein C7974DRAFT_44882 [Boeremia exigua]KAH6616437.1 hypothetical protein C7974DRAFT_44882 [Boeremia exigua]